MSAVERTIDSALTSDAAYDLAEEYVRAKHRLGLSGWAIGVKPDPVAGPDGKHGYLVYARQLPEQEPPATGEIPAQRSLPAMQHRHVNRNR